MNGLLLQLVSLLAASALAASVASAQDKPTGTTSTAKAIAANAAMSCAVSSPKHTVALVELFTSQGCSSCPPADRWLRNLPRAGYGFDRVVPLSLHVGYWDYIGWKDPFAQPRFTDRQREYARRRQSTSVYTPQVVLAGNDFRAWGDASLARQVSALANRPATASIELDAAVVGSVVQVKAAARLAASQTSPAPAASDTNSTVQLHFAVFEMGLTHKVTRGENSGETLTNDFVVRQWHGPLPLMQGKISAKALLALEASGAHRQLGVAAFIQGSSGEILQATACIMQ